MKVEILLCLGAGTAAVSGMLIAALLLGVVIPIGVALLGGVLTAVLFGGLLVVAHLASR